MIRHLMNILLWFLPPTRLFWFRRHCLRLAAVELADGVCFSGRGWIYGRGRLRVGRDTWLSPGVIVHTNIAAAIAIGERCDIGPGVEFVTGSHEIGPSSRRGGKGTASSILVGNGCWIGAGARILGGVEIGDGAVIAAGAVVVKNVPGNALAAGVPAVVKRILDEHATPDDNCQ